MLKRFESFVTGITTCYKSIQKIKSAEMDKFGLGLKGTHVMCIFFLYMNPDGLTASHLSKLCSEDKAAISRAVSTLQEKGFIHPTEKKYRDILHLTEEGISLAEKINVLISGWVISGGESLTEEEREIFYRCLKKISDNLKTQNDL
ncbi:MAG: MarR family transcriptional regulator [Eubacteriaceae bacterium]|nr:MarR family transcriptional regulator [Eubacteriaceae bacterium]